MSVNKFACQGIATAIDETVESAVETSFARFGKSVDLFTHPDVLEHSTQFLPKVPLAKLYQYGYWPSGLNIRADGYTPSHPDIDPESDFEYPYIILDHASEQPVGADSETETIDEEEAVAKLAQRATEDQIEWKEYIPWYHSLTLPSYRVTQVAASQEWSEFPPRPTDRPMINDRFTAMESPRVGDFIRTAVLQQLEASRPAIVNVDVGQEQWTTDRVSLFIEPTDRREPGIDWTGLCPRGALTTLAKFGYRPIAGTYNAPLKGYDRDDPPVPRKVTFARGKTLQEWTRRTLLNASLFEEPEQINRHAGILDLPWETLLPAMRAQILTYDDLYNTFQRPN